MPARCLASGGVCTQTSPWLFRFGGLQVLALPGNWSDRERLSSLSDFIHSTNHSSLMTLLAFLTCHESKLLRNKHHGSGNYTQSAPSLQLPVLLMNQHFITLNNEIVSWEFLISHNSFGFWVRDKNNCVCVRETPC